MTSASPSFNNPTLTQNIGFAAQSPQNIGFNLPTTSSATFNTTSNDFNGTGPSLNNFSIGNQNSSAASPLSDLDEFDVITNRNKSAGSSLQTTNNGIYQ